MAKDLKEKAIDIKGKKYVLVSDRVLAFNETYPNGSIQTELLSEPQDKTIVMKATITIEGDTSTGKAIFTGHAQEVIGDGYINKTSALENAETSAVGRALAMMGIGVIDSIASVDEINKAENRPQTKKSDKSDLTCSVCGEQGLISYKKDPNGRPYCPNWKEHKAKDEKWDMVVPGDTELSQNEIDFDENMPDEK